LPSIVGGLAGIAVLGAVLATVRDAAHPALAHPMARAAAGDEGLLARRSFLKVTGGVVAVGIGAASAGRWLQGRFSAAASRMAVILPKAKDPVAPLAKGVELDVAGISPFITSNADFYRIDTNLTVPQISAEEWKLTIKGMVDREVTLTYEDVLALPMVEERITLTCVSNEVGGDLAGHARWLGAPLAALLDEVGVRPGADQVVTTSSDGWTCGTPTDACRKTPDAMLAIGMNGEPLPIAHGFPVRMLVPGLYGYVSGTKWIVDMELTTFAAFDPYWVKRGWKAQGPIKVMSRIDTPRGLSQVPAGRTVKVAGVAWAQTRGIARVEVRVDGGPWQQATLAPQANLESWRQWVWDWTPTSAGLRTVQVRATDGDGTTQPEAMRPPFPDGATGWHDVVVTVT
jgi:DMSO/TMAO reductase YedYZ molybdopterin-dependent catalytic subunit